MADFDTWLREHCRDGVPQKPHEFPDLAALCAQQHEFAEGQPCAHRQWYISKGVKHVTHEDSCMADKECEVSCSRCVIVRAAEAFQERYA